MMHLLKLTLLVPICRALPASAAALLQLATTLRSPELALLVLVMLIRLASLKRTPGPRDRDAASLKLGTRLVRRLRARPLPTDAVGCSRACPSAGACTSHIQESTHGLSPAMLCIARGHARLLRLAQSYPGVSCQPLPSAAASYRSVPNCWSLHKSHPGVSSRPQPSNAVHCSRGMPVCWHQSLCMGFSLHHACI